MMSIRRRLFQSDAVQRASPGPLVSRLLEGRRRRELTTEARRTRRIWRVWRAADLPMFFISQWLKMRCRRYYRVDAARLSADASMGGAAVSESDLSAITWAISRAPRWKVT